VRAQKNTLEDPTLLDCYRERNCRILLGRGPIRISHVLAVGALTAAFLGAGFATHPSALAATSTAGTALHAVTLDACGTIAQYSSSASTVGDFLHEQNIDPGPDDYVDPSPDVPLSDGLVVTYRPSAHVTIETARHVFEVDSTAQNVGALLQQQKIVLGPHDLVHPPTGAALPANGTIVVTRVRIWDRNETRPIAMETRYRLDFSLPPNGSKLIAKGRPGLRRVHVRFTQRDDRTITATILSSKLLRKARPQVVADGVGRYDAFMHLVATGVVRSAYMSQSALQMVATAYTAGCAGCSGMTAIGLPAGHGIVAVDPRVIPLGTHLYIPGYGIALAGDTGGAIVGNRIDLGFDSERDAIEFGRRDITVYRLK
jgi:3D (Asp-Asp-Asp) domain-containing protein